MKLTKSQLKEIIDQEVLNLSEDEEEAEESPGELRSQMAVEDLAAAVMKLVGSHPDGMEVLKQAFEGLYDVAVEFEGDEEEIDPYTPMGPEASPVRQSIGFREGLQEIIVEEMARVMKEYGDPGAMGHAKEVLRLALPFTEWIDEVEKLGFEFGEESPNPYDAWLGGATPAEYSGQGDLDEVIKKEGDNYVVKSEDGKTLGTHSSRKKAQAQLYAIHQSQEEGD